MYRAELFGVFENDICDIHESLLFEMITSAKTRYALEEFSLSSIKDAIKNFFRKLFGKIKAFLTSLLYSEQMFNIKGLTFIKKFSEDISKRIRKFTTNDIQEDGTIIGFKLNMDAIMLDIKNIITVDKGMENYEKKISFSDLNKIFTTPITLAQSKIEKELKTEYTSMINSEDLTEEDKKSATASFNKKIITITTLCTKITTYISKMLNICAYKERNNASNVDIDFSQVELK